LQLKDYCQYTLSKQSCPLCTDVSTIKASATTALITLVAALLSTGTAPVSARCFRSGMKYASKDLARFHATRACQGFDGHRGAFQGHFAPGEVKSACVPYAPEQRLKMSVRNLNSREGFDLHDHDCAFRLSAEINNCDRGSEIDVAGWRFR
jgi:hypothetical protein